MNEYRLTRPEAYGPNTYGHTDKSARQGYYVDATTPQEAIEKFKKLYPEFKHSKVDVQLWKTNI